MPRRPRAAGAERLHDSASLLADTLALALQLQHPACFYLALARRADVQLITADRRFHARCHAGDAAALGKRVRMLDAWPQRRSGLAPAPGPSRRRT